MKDELRSTLVSLLSPPGLENTLRPCFGGEPSTSGAEQWKAL